MPSGKAKSRTPKNARKADGVRQKRGPYSLYAVLRAIRRRWGNPADSDRLVEDFTPLFVPYFTDVISRYPGAYAEAKNVRQFIERTESTNVDLRYYALRAYADYVGLPTGLLLLYSHVVGDARAGKSGSEMVQFLRQSALAVQSLAAFIEQQPDPLAAFSNEPASATKYNARVEGLARMHDAFSGAASS